MHAGDSSSPPPLPRSETIGPEDVAFYSELQRARLELAKRWRTQFPSSTLEALDQLCAVTQNPYVRLQLMDDVLEYPPPEWEVVDVNDLNEEEKKEVDAELTNLGRKRTRPPQ